MYPGTSGLHTEGTNTNKTVQIHCRRKQAGYLSPCYSEPCSELDLVNGACD